MTPLGSHAEPCAIHADHRPEPYDVEVHHVWPLGMGGPDVKANVVPVCPTGHTNVHALLRLAFRHHGVDKVPWVTRRRFHSEERRLARMGFLAATGDEAMRARLSGPTH